MRALMQTAPLFGRVSKPWQPLGARDPPQPAHPPARQGRGCHPPVFVVSVSLEPRGEKGPAEGVWFWAAAVAPSALSPGSCSGAGWQQPEHQSTAPRYQSFPERLKVFLPNVNREIYSKLEV